MVVSIMAVLSNAPDASDDWGIEWREPATMTIHSVKADKAEEALMVRLSLWDSQGMVTEWDGDLTLQLRDEDNREVFAAGTRVRADDFTTVKVAGIINTYLLVSIPFTAMDGATERMLVNPDYDVGVRATFEIDRSILEATRWWWPEPTYVKIESVLLDDDMALMDVFLLDEERRTTRWSGDLRIIVVDSLGFELYNESRAVLAGEFNLMDWGGTGWVWDREWVPFEDMVLSKDRLEGEDQNDSRWMRFFATFGFEGVELRQDPGGPTASSNTFRIPDALLVPNEAPEARLTADRIGLTGRECEFDASATRDDLGTEGLVYEWSWGDGSLVEVTDVPFARHTFTRAGSFQVRLRVVDVEGAAGEASVSVAVLQEPRVDPGNVGSGELVDGVTGSYLVTRLVEVLPSTAQRR